MKKEKVVDAVIEEEKAYFLPRLGAYIIDAILITVICLGLNMVIPQNKNHDKYVEEFNQVQQDYKDKKITSKQFINRSKDLTYDLDYTSTISTLTNIVVLTLYFGVLQFYNKGQTLGKKLTKVKIISTNNKELSLNQLVLRSLLISSIFIKLVSVACVLFMKGDIYYYTSMVLQAIDAGLIIICLLMAVFRKDGKGLHDILFKTKVIGN